MNLSFKDALEKLKAEKGVNVLEMAKRNATQEELKDYEEEHKRWIEEQKRKKENRKNKK